MRPVSCCPFSPPCLCRPLGRRLLTQPVHCQAVLPSRRSAPLLRRQQVRPLPGAASPGFLVVNDNNPRADRGSRESCSPPSMFSAAWAGQPFAVPPPKPEPPRLRRHSSCSANHVYAGKPGNARFAPSWLGVVAAPSAPSRCALPLIAASTARCPSRPIRPSGSPVPAPARPLPMTATSAFSRAGKPGGPPELAPEQAQPPAGPLSGSLPAGQLTTLVRVADSGERS